MDPVAQSKATVQKTIASLLDAGDTHSNESLSILANYGVINWTNLVVSWPQ